MKLFSIFALLCNCPDDGILGDIPASDCPFDLKQIQRIAFATQGQVIWDSADGTGTGLLGVPQVDSQLDTLADWQARLTAVDATKMVISPLIGGDPIIEAGEAITEGGGDNTTLNGAPEVTGTNPSSFSAVFKSLQPATEKALKQLGCKNLEVYFILEGGRIVAEGNDTNATLKGLNVQSFFVSDRNNAGFGTKDTNTISFELPAGWSENIVLVDPVDFNPLYDI